MSAEGWTAPSPELAELAKALGVATEYWDQSGKHQVVSHQTLEAVLTALGVDALTAQGRKKAWDEIHNGPWRRMLPHVVVARQGHHKEVQIHVPDGAPVTAWVQLEQGGNVPMGQVDRYVPPRNIDGVVTGEATFAVPADLPLGWHQIQAVSDNGESAPLVAKSVLVVTPNYLGLPESLASRRTFGLMAQVYATRSQDSWGMGDLHDLSTLATWGGQKGAGFVLVNPMHAAEVSAPMENSPYLPATRRYFNPIYLHIEDIPEFVKLDAKAKKRLAALETPLKAMNLTDAHIDRDAVWTAKKEALELILDSALSPARQASFDAFVEREGTGLKSFAIWCAIAELHGISSGTWEAGLRSPSAPGVAKFAEKHAKRIDFFMKLQWLLDEQFANVQAAAKAAGMKAGIVHDLAVGVHPEGADAWALADVLAQGVSVGAPPDMYNQMGQDWSQPPWRPDALVEAAYLPYRDMLRTILRHSGGIRVDHALGLFRLWWIPNGMGAANGTFVKYDHEALVGILALEAARVGAFVVGEDLGTVEPWIIDYLKERGIAGTSILWFERDANGGPLAPEHWRKLCLGTVTVHDIPPTAGFIDGEHIRLRESLGLLARPVADEWHDHEREQAEWEALLRSRGFIDETSWSRPVTVEQKVEGFHRVLAHTPCQLVAIAVPDLFGDTKAQNQPGTNREYANWCIPTCHADGRPMLLEELFDKPSVMERADRVVAAITHRRHW